MSPVSDHFEAENETKAPVRAMSHRRESGGERSQETECVKLDGPFRTVDELELATLSWVHWSNENWLHSSIRCLTPVEAENAYYREINSQPQPMLGELALH